MAVRSFLGAPPEEASRDRPAPLAAVVYGTLPPGPAWAAWPLKIVMDRVKCVVDFRDTLLL